ncbi:glutathione synthase [Tothia fuscella]|uniref:Glutathione synthetase n=1 Tax=Tothia fuscella TaxID=1048955 RepID=A0A9P4NXA8_9PEZI|nr:glutathione synthase [Tothia fuscella]
MLAYRERDYSSSMAASASLSKQQLTALIEDTKDYQITHGSLLKVVNTNTEENVALTRAIPVSLSPTRFSRHLFEEAKGLQKIFNRLYMRVASDEEFLHRILKPPIDNDTFKKTLWNIHIAARKTGRVQDVSLKTLRSDYMIHRDEGVDVNGNLKKLQLKQVEFNTFSVAGVYMRTWLRICTSICVKLELTELGGLTFAHNMYKSQDLSRRSGILFIVQHNNFNICDEQPLEYVLWNQEPPIPTYRLNFCDVLDHVSLGPSRELLYTSSSCPFKPLEILVVYFRAGYQPEEYDKKGIAARILLEISRAIQCPSILSHLTTFKKVQQELAMPGVLERLLPQEECDYLRATFAPLYPSDASELGLQARALTMDLGKAASYVLKPSLEGGGNNVYDADIPDFLELVPEERWDQFTLMKMINSPSHDGMLMSSDGIYEGPTISELGIFGVCLWRREVRGGGHEILDNMEIGWSFKTKPEDVGEMSVVKGYGFLDSPSGRGEYQRK